jgi:hypothetical protein
MRAVSGRGVRRPIVAGLLLGVIIASIRNYLDHRHAESNHKGTYVSGDVFHGRFWRDRHRGGDRFRFDRRRSGRSAAVVGDAASASASASASSSAAASSVASLPTSSSNASSSSASSSSALPRTDPAPAGGAVVVDPLDLVYPDPFAPPHLGCEPRRPMPGIAAPRALDRIGGGGGEEEEEEDGTSTVAWPVNCDGHEVLCELLRKTAIQKEVLVAVADSRAPGVYAFVDAIKKLPVPNFLVVTLDDVLHDQLAAMKVPRYRVKNEKGATGSHKVSALKFTIIKEFVGVGCSVLLTDTDVMYVQNPFPFLYRDHDVESMSDGWDGETAHGWMDQVDDPAMGAGGRRRAKAFRVAALNSGMWCVSCVLFSSQWSPYDRIGVVHAVPRGLYFPSFISAHPTLSIPTRLDAFQLRF